MDPRQPGPSQNPKQRIKLTLTCSICENTFETPTQVDCCKLVFCRSCIENHIEKTRQCFNCKSPLDYTKCKIHSHTVEVLKRMRPIVLRKEEPVNTPSEYQTTLSQKEENRNGSHGTEEYVAFYVYFKPSVIYEPGQISNSTKKMDIMPNFHRGYTCPAQMTIGKFRRFLTEKFSLDKKCPNIQVVLRSNGHILKDNTSLRTVAYRRDDPKSLTMIIDLHFMNKRQIRQQVRASSSKPIAQKSEEGGNEAPPVLEQMPALDAEGPSEEVGTLQQVEASSSATPTNYIQQYQQQRVQAHTMSNPTRPYVYGVRHNVKIAPNPFPMPGFFGPPQPEITIGEKLRLERNRNIKELEKIKQQLKDIKVPPHILIITSDFMPINHTDKVELFPRIPYEAERNTIRERRIFAQRKMEEEHRSSGGRNLHAFSMYASMEPFVPSGKQPYQMNAEQTTRAVQFYYVYAVEKRTPPGEFLNIYYDYCGGLPRRNVRMTADEFLYHQWRMSWDQRGAQVPLMTAELQTRIYNDYSLTKGVDIDKVRLLRLTPEERSEQRAKEVQKRKAIVEKHKEMTKIAKQTILSRPNGVPAIVHDHPVRKTDVSAYVSSTPLLAPPPTLSSAKPMHMQDNSREQQQRDMSRPQSEKSGQSSSSPPPLLVAENAEMLSLLAEEGIREDNERMRNMQNTPTISSMSSSVSSKSQSPTATSPPVMEPAQPESAKRTMNDEEEKKKVEPQQQPKQEYQNRKAPSLVANPQNLDALTLSRQSAKPLGYLLAGALRSTRSQHPTNSSFLVRSSSPIPITKP